ncbi:hypothetical protein NPX13_g3806 [Xylaria arbuscula]|uniref:Uncharacterized protein n=1 Tax=Xylaria arbuscula TaxID=114810 RepID=A0A9W8TP77_9PEZI|nr:hypothetical protein NPX13_g3806 [Xylaria arbuscula]
MGLLSTEYAVGLAATAGKVRNGKEAYSPRDNAKSKDFETAPARHDGATMLFIANGHICMMIEYIYWTPH